jgi:hypothetical protein
MRTRVLVVAALVFIPAVARAGGHRAEAAATFAGLFRASSVDGFGASYGLPLCLFTRGDDCDTNYWSLVVAHSGLSGEHEESGSETKDVEVEFLLAGVRVMPRTHKRLVPFAHLLIGGIRLRETGQQTGAAERFGNWGSGAAATATLGLEFVLARYKHLDVRYRAQYGFALYGIGDDTRWGHGYATALSVGWEVGHGPGKP